MHRALSIAAAVASCVLVLSTAPVAAQPVAAPAVACASDAGHRTQCAADTTAGVALVRSSGTAACLLGRTWGYDQTSIWVSDGCSGEFVTGSSAPADSTSVAA